MIEEKKSAKTSRTAKIKSVQGHQSARTVTLPTKVKQVRQRQTAGKNKNKSGSKNVDNEKEEVDAVSILPRLILSIS